MRGGGIVPSDNGPAGRRYRHCGIGDNRPAARAGIEGMAFLIVLAALCFLMYVAYRGHSVILFAPVAALGAVLLTDPTLVAPMFTGLFMDKMVGFLKLYFPVFLLGAVFGKVIELSGFARAIVYRPDWLFLDEATAALDEPAEKHMYELVRRRLPGTTLVSIAHRPAVAAFHDRQITVDPTSRRVVGEEVQVTT